MGSLTTAVVLFTRLPQDEPKFRDELPDRSVAGLFQQLLTRASRAVTQFTEVDLLVSVATDSPQSNLRGFFPQRGGSFGERLANAMHDAFALGYERVIVMGNDCPELTVDDLRAAARALDQHQCVVGPAEDGGCYLVGLHGVTTEMLSSVGWQRHSNCASLIQALVHRKHTFALLEARLDLDRMDDLRRFAARHRRHADHARLISYIDACLSAQRARREGIPVEEKPYIPDLSEERIDWQIPRPVSRN